MATNISNQELQALPILNRNWLAAVSLAPGIQLQSSTASFACESLIVGGGSNRSGNFSVDGGGNNDDYLGISCGSQTRTGARGGAGIPGADQPVRRRVRPHRRRRDQRHHQAGHATRSAASLFGSYTGDRVTAQDFFVAQNNLEKPDTAQTDWGGTLGGPILKDRMHFFYSLDRLVYAEGRSNTFTARPELDYSNTQRMKLWNHMVRVDHQLNSNNSWSARYLGRELADLRPHRRPPRAGREGPGVRHRSHRGGDVERGVRQHPLQHAARRAIRGRRTASPRRKCRTASR